MGGAAVTFTTEYTKDTESHRGIYIIKKSLRHLR
jgi:hypothetical protein